MGSIGTAQATRKLLNISCSSPEPKRQRPGGTYNDYAAIAKSLEDQAASKPQLTVGGLITDNCSLRVNQALDAAGGEGINMGFAAGLNAPLPSMPGSAGYRAATSGLQIGGFEIPQNSLPNAKQRSLIKQFEPPAPVKERVNPMPTQQEKKTIGPEK